ncbi:hypothetical protein O4J55_18820, partial [Paracoccus sp. PXZ]
GAVAGQPGRLALNGSVWIAQSSRRQPVLGERILRCSIISGRIPQKVRNSGALCTRCMAEMPVCPWFS